MTILIPNASYLSEKDCKVHSFGNLSQDKKRFLERFPFVQVQGDPVLFHSKRCS